MLTLLTLLVACFSQLDVVIDSPLLDSQEDSAERKEAERQTHTFMTTVLQCVSHTINGANLRLISGLLGLFMERCDTVSVGESRVSRYRLLSRRVANTPSNEMPIIVSPAYSSIAE